MEAVDLLPPEIWAHIRQPDSKTRDIFYRHAGKFLVTSNSTHWWCTKGVIVEEFLPLFIEDQPAVHSLRASLGDQMQECMDCVVAYYRHKDNCIKRLQNPNCYGGYGQSLTSRQIEKFKQLLIRLAGERLLARLRHAIDQDTAKIGLTFELLYQIHHTENTQLWDLWTTYMLKESVIEQAKALSPNLMRSCPGLYLLCVHPKLAVRRWAQPQVSDLGHIAVDGSVAAPQFKVLLPMFLTIADVLIHDRFDPDDTELSTPTGHIFERQGFWNGFVFLLQRLGNNVGDYLEECPTLLDVIVNSIYDDQSTIFIQASKALETLLLALGPRFWQYLDGPAQYTMLLEPFKRQVIGWVVHALSFLAILLSLADSSKSCDC